MSQGKRDEIKRVLKKQDRTLLKFSKITFKLNGLTILYSFLFFPFLLK